MDKWRLPPCSLFLGLAPQVQHCSIRFCEAAKTAGSIVQQVSCGYLEQGQVAVMPCSFVSKPCLSCHFFCSIPLGRASPFYDCEAWGVFSLLEWAHLSLWAYALGCPGWRLKGSWAKLSGQTLGSGKLSLLALADTCDLPPEYSRIDI